MAPARARSILRTAHGHVRLPSAPASRTRLRRQRGAAVASPSTEAAPAARTGASPRTVVWKMPPTRAKQVGAKITTVPSLVTDAPQASQAPDGEANAMSVRAPGSAARPSRSAGADARRDAASVAMIVEHTHRLASACSAVAAGFDACAKHARNNVVIDAARVFAVTHRVLADEVASFGVSLGAPSRRRAATSERLRWEWLASTAALLDGTPDLRMLAECARLLRVAGEAAVVLELALEDHEPSATRDIRHIHVLLDRARAAVAELEGRLTQRPPFLLS